MKLLSHKINPVLASLLFLLLSVILIAIFQYHFAYTSTVIDFTPRTMPKSIIKEELDINDIERNEKVLTIKRWNTVVAVPQTFIHSITQDSRITAYNESIPLNSLELRKNNPSSGLFEITISISSVSPEHETYEQVDKSKLSERTYGKNKYDCGKTFFSHEGTAEFYCIVQKPDNGYLVLSTAALNSPTYANIVNSVLSSLKFTR